MQADRARPPASGGEARAARDVALLDEAHAGEWDAFVQRGGASPFHTTAWSRLVREQFGHATYLLAARDHDGAMVGALPLVRLRSLLFGDFLVSTPFVTAGGAVADDPSVVEALYRETARLGERLGVSHAEIRESRPVAVGWPVREEKVSMVRELPGDPAELDRQLRTKLRAQIRRPLREGARATVGGVELLDDFYAVFSSNMRDLGTPVYSRRFFRAVLEALPERTRIVAVHVGTLPVAAGLLLGDGDRLEIPWASSLRSHNRIGANMLLYWEALCQGIELGYARFDFGRSTRDSGTYRFKRQWGAEERPLHWYYWLRDGGEPPRMNPDDPKYALAIRIWRRLPLAVANAIGPLVVRNLP